MTEVPASATAVTTVQKVSTTPVDATRRFRRRLMFAGGLVVAGTILAIVVWEKVHTGSPIRYVTEAASVGAVTRMVASTGTVNPELTVIVGSYVSGVIQDMYCDYNTQVKTGQVCAKIDPRPYQTAVDQAKANLAVGNAQLQKDRAALTYAKVNYERNAMLVKTNAVSLDAVDNAKSVYEQAQAQLVYDQATIEQRQAELQAAQVNLGYTNIISPVDGTVVSRNITIGQTVAASFQTPTLFLIASDLTKMQVDTNVSEGDIGGIELGDKVQFSVDAFQQRSFGGQVTQIRQSPQTVQNVVTYDVVVGVDNKALALKPGMTASVRIITDQRQNVLRVPGQALRYTPQGAARSEAGKSRVWVLREAGLVAVQIEPGLSDDDYVEVRGGDLKAGDQVIVAERAGAGQGRPPRP
mgnify:CR=1 FL=1